MAAFDDTVPAYSAEHVTQITKLTDNQLVYWDKSGFFHPEFAARGEGRSAVRVYSFREVVSLRTVSILKDEYKISPQNLRRTLGILATYPDDSFANLRLSVRNKEVQVDNSEPGGANGARPGQCAMVVIAELMNEVKQASLDLTRRQTDQIGRFEQHRGVVHNALVIAGTRIAVRTIEHFLEDGYGIEQILREYPSLTREDIESVARGRVTPAAA